MMNTLGKAVPLLECDYPPTSDVALDELEVLRDFWVAIVPQNDIIHCEV